MTPVFSLFDFILCQDIKISTSWHVNLNFRHSEMIKLTIFKFKRLNELFSKCNQIEKIT